MKCSARGHENREGAAFCETCGKGLTLVCSNCQAELRPSARFCDSCGQPVAQPESSRSKPDPLQPVPPLPTSFANGRYEVKKFLGEGGKKRVYLAHDTTLDRDVAFALIKTEGLDDAGRTRIQREGQAMARLTHPHIMTLFDLGVEGEHTEP